jgi:TPR repeat protein
MISRAKSNDGEALQTIGYTYRNKRRYSKAMAWFQLAANQNNINAYTTIGMMYHNGHGVSEDHLTALEYYLRAVRAGYTLPMSNIAALFLQENGLSALEWLIKC